MHICFRVLTFLCLRYATMLNLIIVLSRKTPISNIDAKKKYYQNELCNFCDKTWDRTSMLTDVLVRYLMY